MQPKKELLRTIRKATKPPKGFGQWVLVVEHQRLNDNLGLFVVEAQFNGHDEWSGSISVNLPERKKTGSDGQEIPSEWDALEAGESRYSVVTLEMRGKSIIQTAKEFFKRTLEDGKLQDFLPFIKS